MARDPQARRSVAAAVALAVVLAACAAEQDPGLAPGGGPAQTSDTLAPCPAGGPDATTSPAGCLDDDGRVVRP